MTTVPPDAGELTCPVCQTKAPADAYFCETCGFDFLTGSRPRGAQAEPTEVAPGGTAPTPAAADSGGLQPAGDEPPATEPSGEQPGEPEPPALEPLPPVTTLMLDDSSTHEPPPNPLVAEPAPARDVFLPPQAAAQVEDSLRIDAPLPTGRDVSGPQPPPSLGAPRPAPDQAVAASPGPAARQPDGPVPPRPMQPPAVHWVAEVWIDPEWYRVQQAPDQLPSPGQPIIQGLSGSTAVIGRRSGGHRPDIDCSTDSGVSRRQAALTSDGRRWFLEDLGSANGTYVGQVDKPLPTEPISGRVELQTHDRIYVGSWTRIVVRPALVQEAGL